MRTRLDSRGSSAHNGKIENNGFCAFLKVGHSGQIEHVFGEMELIGDEKTIGGLYLSFSRVTLVFWVVLLIRSPYCSFTGSYCSITGPLVVIQVLPIVSI